jgi:LDH2 family malate/lactate/ureidoglycolate dehydrogenase
MSGMSSGSPSAATAGQPVRVAIEPMEQLAVALLEHAGAPSDRARIVVRHLLEASAMGLHSHGVMRIPQYLDEIASGFIDPLATIDVRHVTPTRLLLEGNHAFGQVAGAELVNAVVPVARELGMAIGTVRGVAHTGRIGAYPEAAAQQGFIALACCNGGPSGHWVAPFGGRDGRISTNPMAFAWPVAGQAPAVADFSTGATAEGVVRSLRFRGLSAPPGTLRDAEGRETNDPGTLYKTPKGAIQPLGGPLGYRGTALGLLVEVLTTLLADKRVDDHSRVGNDMTLLAIAPDTEFPALAEDLGNHLRASPPIDPTRPVMMPGDRERANAAASVGVEVDGPTWAALTQAAARAGIPMPEPLPQH